MNIEDIKVYRINDKVVWTEGQDVEDLKKLMHRSIDDMTVIPSAVAQSKALIQTEMPKVETKNSEPHTGTKLERARAIFQANKEKSRKEIIQIFVTELNMTPAGASTYHAQCKKMLS